MTGASGDFASFDLSVAEPLLCQGERAGNNACVAWAYMQAFGNRGRPHCWLKNSSPAAVVNLDVTSGAKSAAPPTIGDIWEFTGRRAMATIAGAGDGSITIQRPPKSLLVTLDFINSTTTAGSGSTPARRAPARPAPDGSSLDNNPKTVAIVAAGDRLYQLHNDGWIWRYTGTPCNGERCPGWERLDDNAKTVAIAAADDNLYQLHNDGWIWQYTGTTCTGIVPRLAAARQQRY